MKEFHKHYHEGNLTLRDYLAAHRTVLANDRTWLGSIRTSVAFFVAGVSFIQFFESEIIQTIGWAFVPIGILSLIYGYVKYKERRRMIKTIKIKKKIKEILKDDDNN